MTKSRRDAEASMREIRRNAARWERLGYTNAAARAYELADKIRARYEEEEPDAT